MVVGGYFIFYECLGYFILYFYECLGYVVYISESRHIQEGPIRQNFPLFI